VVDVLPERSAAALSQWLAQHPEVKVISRDRQGVYAEGARRGAPDALQVADRFHLVLNLRQAVERALAVQRPHLRLSAPSVSAPPSTDSVKGGRGRLFRTRSRVQQQALEAAQQRRQQQLELFAEIKKRKAAGLKVSQIAAHLGLNRRRIDRWVRLDVLPERNRMAPRPGLAESFRDYLRQRWEAGVRHGRTLFAEIRELGYRGSYSHLAKLLSPWRQPTESVLPPAEEARIQRAALQPPGKQIAPQIAAALLLKSPAELSAQQAEIVKALKQQCPDFAVMRRLALSFRALLRDGKPTTLHRWMKRAENTGIHALQRFVRTLKQDLLAVEAAVQQPWSNGPVEGHIHRLKLLKRQMYGRAGVELLRARLFPESVFTGFE
jgi:transposase